MNILTIWQLSLDVDLTLIIFVVDIKFSCFFSVRIVHWHESEVAMFLIFEVDIGVMRISLHVCFELCLFLWHFKFN